MCVQVMYGWFKSDGTRGRCDKIKSASHFLSTPFLWESQYKLLSWILYASTHMHVCNPTYTCMLHLDPFRESLDSTSTRHALLVYLFIYLLFFRCVVRVRRSTYNDTLRHNNLSPVSMSRHSFVLNGPREWRQRGTLRRSFQRTLWLMSLFCYGRASTKITHLAYMFFFCAQTSIRER